MGWGFFDWLPLVVAALVFAYWVAIVIVLIVDGRDATRTLVWLLLLWALPVLGLILYFFFGRNWKKKTMKGAWAKEIRRIAQPTLRRVNERYAADAAEAKDWCRGARLRGPPEAHRGLRRLGPAAGVRRGHHHERP